MSGREPIMIVAGTRPEAIKLAPVFWGLDKLGIDYVFVWSGQHYDYEMSRIFFDQLGLPKPVIDLDVRSGSHAEQTARIMMDLEKAVEKYKPSIVVAQGDTNTVVATALTSTKMLVPFAHVEAGLRSWDRTMPEEINRIIADAVAEIHFAPTELSAINLMHGGIPLRKIHVTGNTIVDVVYKYRDYVAKEGEELLSELGLEPLSYVLVTVHRQENTDNPNRLENIVKALIEISKHYTLVFPAHPRTVNRLQSCGLWSSLASRKNIRILKPLGYFQFLGLLMKCLIVLTDSGGVQEEACTLKIPTITLRYNTERPETVLVGINRVVGVKAQRVVDKALKTIDMRDSIVANAKSVQNPLGDGRAGERIGKILKEAVEQGIRVETIDSRANPYITYAILEYVFRSSNNSKELLRTGDIVAMYDNDGIAVADPSKARRIVIRLPRTETYKIEGTDQGSSHT